ncbi:hypothetical protein [Planococcus alpniumensis]|uniref:hypothetical protein n=1 Tax=Planococcus alpniumensis TaxID=2708345 RepID=UPI001B8D22A8|nr:hypothetical protein [Planococcus sp. MSAK28401]
MDNSFQKRHFASRYNYMSTWLTYSQLFNRKASKEEIIADIQRFELSEALIILAKFSVLDEEGKRKLMEYLGPQMRNQFFVRNTEPVVLITVLYSFKWFLAYGTENPKYAFTTGQSKLDNLLTTILKIADLIEAETDNTNDINIEDQILKASLFSLPGEMDQGIIRQHLMFEDIARKAEDSNSYIDIHSIFEREYGYSIKQYVSTVFSLEQLVVQGVTLENLTSFRPWGIKPSMYFNESQMKDTALKITEELSTNIDLLRNWAKKTLNNPYDYEQLLKTPLLKVNEFIIPISDAFIQQALFDGLYFKIDTACKNNKKDFPQFFGEIFEKYVQRVLQSSVGESEKLNYQYINEFLLKDKTNDWSSDAFVKLGKSLLIVECKSGRILKETKVSADRKKGNDKFKIYASEAIRQANDAYKAALQHKSGKFEQVEQVTIISVSMQSFPKLPSYNQMLEQLKLELHSHVKIIDYVGLSDLEILASVISQNDSSVFSYIESKKANNEYLSYYEFHSEFHTNELTKFFNEVLNTANAAITETFFGPP